MLGTRLFAITSAVTVFRVKFSTKTRLNRKLTKPIKRPNDDGSKPSASTEWTDQQKRVISAVQDGASVFISGSAGTGKTFLVRHLITLLRKRHKSSAVFATGSTGVAACALNGQTLHSFAGVGAVNPAACGGLETVLDRIFSTPWACKRWLRVKALIIDEISMVDGEFFEILERVARAIRGIDSPWGGIQLVVSGDFFQLPPVWKDDAEREKEFAFEADCWDSSFGLQVELEKVFRQSDPKIIELLEGIRRGECDPEGMKLLKQKCSTPDSNSSVVELYPRNIEVLRVNMERMRRLRKEVIKFTAVDSGEERWVKELKKGMAPDEISLCEGARVMLIKNLNVRRKLVNGSVGTVVGFHDNATSSDKGAVEVCSQGVLPRVEFDNGVTMVIEPESWVVEDGSTAVAERKQLPLILAWSISIHKCQGMTLERLRTNLSKAFGYGMVYVALSRASSLEGLYLSGFDPKKIKAHPKVVQFYENLSKQQGRKGVLDDVAERPEESGPKGPQCYFSLEEFLQQIK